VNTTARSIFTSFAFWSLAALFAGLGLGILGYTTENGLVEQLAALVQPLGALWLRALRLVVLPLVVLQLLTALTGQKDGSGIGRIGGRALVFIVLGSVSIMLVSLALALPLVSLYVVSPGTAETIRNSVAITGIAEQAAAAPMSLGDWLTGLIPANVVEAFVEEQIIQVLLVTVLLGLAVNRLPEEHRRPLSVAFHALNDAVLILIRWILFVTPVGVFALTIGLALGTGVEAAGVLGAFLLMNQGVQLLFVVALYPLSALLGRVSLRAFARALIPVQLVALSTRSSLATTPAQIKSGQENLGFGPTTTGLVVPLCVSFFKITLLITNPVKLIFLAHIFGMTLSPGQVVSFLLTILLINFTELGLPKGGVPFRSMPAFIAVGIPIEGLVLLDAANDLEDYPDTLANATGMFAAATVLSKGDRVQSKADRVPSEGDSVEPEGAGGSA
jgi:Na+/H+-dicarboxylate symporter